MKFTKREYAMMNADQKYFNMNIEPLLNTPEMAAIQEQKLKQAVRYFYDNVPFDRRRMDAAGITPDKVKTFSDLSKALPICGQEDFRKIFQEVDHDMVAAFNILFGPERMKTLHLLTTTSGTTGVPTPYPVFEQTTEAMGEIWGRIGWRLNMRPGDRMAIGFGLSMHAAGIPHVYWFKKIKGLTLIPIGAEVGTERLLNFIKLFKANVLSCTPSLAQYLIERAEDVLNDSVESLGIKTLMCGAEPGAGIPEVRSRLESAYGATVYDVGAGYGVSCNHPEYQGMHWIADDFCHYELVDPKTHEPIPLEHGATGLAVFTPLDPEGSIFFHNMRFTLNDIHQVFTDPCPCGNSGFRYKIVGRADDMLKVKGVPVYPAAIQGVINGFIPKVTGAFRIVLDVPPPRVIPPLKIRIEYGEGVTENELPDIEAALLAKMHSINKISPQLTWLKPNTLERAVKKTQLLEKAYENK